MKGCRLRRDSIRVSHRANFLVVVWFLTAGGPDRDTGAMLCSETLAAYEQQRQPKDVDRVNLQGIIFVRQHRH